MIHHIENNQINKEVMENEGLIIIDFFAEWCGPCQMLAPVLSEIDKEYEEINIYKVNVDENQETTMRYGINSVPTMIFFKNGEEVERTVGLISKSELNEIVNNLK